jgi:hypothetical protein
MQYRIVTTLLGCVTNFSVLCLQYALSELKTLIRETIEIFPVSSGNYSHVFRKGSVILFHKV